MKCVISKHIGFLEAYTVYLGNALCKRHFDAAKDFVNGCPNPGKVSSASVIDVLESQAQCGS